MKQISKKQRATIETLCKSVVNFAPDENNMDFKDLVCYKIFFAACLTLYRELGFLSDFTFEIYPMSKETEAGFDGALPLYTADDIVAWYGYVYDHILSLGELSRNYIIPIIECVGWSVTTSEDALEVIDDACLELGVEESIGGLRDEEDYLWPIAVQSCKWRSFFNILRSDKSLCQSNLAKKLFKIIEDLGDFCQCYFWGDESFFALDQGIQFHFLGFNGDTEANEECLSPLFPAGVLWAEYYMWELAKIKPELMSVMMLYEPEDAAK